MHIVPYLANCNQTKTCFSSWYLSHESGFHLISTQILLLPLFSLLIISYGYGAGRAEAASNLEIEASSKNLNSLRKTTQTFPSPLLSISNPLLPNYPPADQVSSPYHHHKYSAMYFIYISNFTLLKGYVSMVVLKQ